MDENLSRHSGGERPSLSAGALAGEYRAASRLLLPRAIFLLMMFGTVLMLAASFFMSAGVTLALALSRFAPALSSALFCAWELLFVFCVLVLHYGLFLIYLRFVRDQPVALSFLFAGFRQRRARKFAAFLMIPPTVSAALSIAPFALSEEFQATYQITQPDALMEYIYAHPEIMREAISCSALFFLLALVLYLPFAFVWPNVYDDTQGAFSKILSRSLKFWKGRFWKFLGFEAAAHCKPLLAVAAFGAGEFLALSKFSGVAAQIASSVFAFASFCSATFLCASVMLSINFFYDAASRPFGGETLGLEQDESPKGESAD